MLIGSTKSRGKDHVPLQCNVVFQYPPLNQVSCVIWYVVVYLTPKHYSPHPDHFLTIKITFTYIHIQNLVERYDLSSQLYTKLKQL